MIPEKTKETSRKKDRERQREKLNVCNVNYFVTQSLINWNLKSNETISKTKIKKSKKIKRN